MTVIRCRARVSARCFDGQPSRKQFGEGYDENVADPPLSEDGTFDGETIVCDPCYVQLGAPTNEELPAVIEEARRSARAE